MAQAPEVSWVLAMEPMSASASGAPPLASPLLALGVLLPVAAFPARLGVVILKRKHPQPRSDNQSNEPEKRGRNAPTWFPLSHADGKRIVDEELEEDR